jgi:hypothetical protein
MLVTEVAYARPPINVISSIAVAVIVLLKMASKEATKVAYSNRRRLLTLLKAFEAIFDC